MVYCSVVAIADNIALVRERIESAARRAARNPQSLTLMAVSKTISVDRIREAYEAGIRLFGENRVQEFGAKSEQFRSLRDAQVHMIGHLQSNKAAHATELFDAIDSVDSFRLAQKLNAAASALGKTLPVLIEVNIGGEAAKSGIAPDSGELLRIFDAIGGLSSIEVRGLMTVPPYEDDPEKSRPYFRKMRVLLEELAGQNRHLATLSMGMSHDFEVAIEEGSTCVRVGTAIFGKRLVANRQ
jgi:PLP dependent protein